MWAAGNICVCPEMQLTCTPCLRKAILAEHGCMAHHPSSYTLLKHNDRIWMQVACWRHEQA